VLHRIDEKALYALLGEDAPEREKTSCLS